MASRHASMLAATGVLLLALTACGGEGVPAPTTPAASTTASSESPAESPSPGTSAPAVAAPDPADYPGMDQQTEEGAKAFYRYFWDSYVYANLTGDPSILESLSGPDCGWCSSAAAEIRQDGATWESGSISYGDMAADLSLDPPAVFATFDAVIQDRSPSSGSASNSEPEKMAAGSNISWVENRWRVDSVDVGER